MYRRSVVVFFTGGAVLTGLVTFAPVWVESAGRVDIDIRFNLTEPCHDKYASFTVYCVQDKNGNYDRLVFPGDEGILEDKRLLDASRLNQRTDWTTYWAVEGGLPFRTIVFAYNAMIEAGGSANLICQFDKIVFYRFLWRGIVANFFIFGTCVLGMYGLALQTRRLVRLNRVTIFPHCSCCGYNLHGLPSGRCPECGHINDLLPLQNISLAETRPATEESNNASAND